jgi:hypothetical protein
MGVQRTMAERGASGSALQARRFERARIVAIARDRRNRLTTDSRLTGSGRTATASPFDAALTAVRFLVKRRASGTPLDE